MYPGLCSMINIQPHPPRRPLDQAARHELAGAIGSWDPSECLQEGQGALVGMVQRLQGHLNPNPNGADWYISHFMPPPNGTDGCIWHFISPPFVMALHVAP